MDDQFTPLFPPISSTTNTAVGEPPFIGVQPESLPDQTSPSPEPPHEPIVTLRKAGDRVTQIEIVCSCGKTLVFDCQY